MSAAWHTSWPPPTSRAPVLQQPPAVIRPRGGSSFENVKPAIRWSQARRCSVLRLPASLGAKLGPRPAYNYSPAMKHANIVWDAKTLDAYLSDPQKVVPENKMPFPGLKTDTDRTDVIAFLTASAGGAQPAAAAAQSAAPPAATAAANHRAGRSNQAAASRAQCRRRLLPDANYTLRSGIAEGRMVYIGVGGAIDGKVNPVLTAAEGQVVQLTLINGEGAEHDIVFPDQNAKSPRVTGKGASTTIAFPRRQEPATSSISAACPAISTPACRANSSSRRGRRRRRWSKPTFRASRPICRRRSASVTRRRSASISSASKSRDDWRREQRSATGPSTAKCPARSSA